MSEFAFVIINNIPTSYHSRDLRNFFSQFIETKGFVCFHFRHRPEVKQNKESSKPVHQVQQEPNPKINDGVNSSTCCCVAKLLPRRCNQFLELYNKMHWLDIKGETLTSRCFIRKIKVTQNPSDAQQQFKTRGQQSQVDPDREHFTAADLKNLAELNPPILMPNGNVGTPTSIFLEHIRTCRLPANLIGKLGLVFARNPNRRYGSVFYDYGTSTALVDKTTTEHDQKLDTRHVKSARGQTISDVYLEKPPEPESQSVCKWL